MNTLQVVPETAPERAYQWLWKTICELPWNQESFLSENTIAAAAGISRAPVREALMRLEATGLIRRIPNKGAYIPALTDRDIQEIMEVRQVIGEWATRKVASGGLLTREALEAVLEKQEDSIGDPIRFIEHDIEFHTLIVHAAGNPMLEQVYVSQYSKQERLGIYAVLSNHERCRSVIAEHRAMAEAIVDRDVGRATQAALSHIGSTRRVLGTPHTA